MMIIAGELSGDMHGANLVRQLKKEDPTIKFWGIGGEHMRDEGVETLYDVEDMAVMGISEVLRRYGFFRKVFNEMRREVKQRSPAAVILVDYPGFNLRFAKKAHQQGIKVIYYVCPQVWAWHRSRIPKMAEIIDYLLVIFPFEVAVFKGHDIKVDFVGHPLVKEAKAALAAAPAELPWKPGTKRLLLLPGSRRLEVEKLLADMTATVSELEARGEKVSCLIAAPNEHIADYSRQQITGRNDVEIVVGQTREALRQADAALVASGTATIEAALMGCPMIVIYRTAALTYAIGKRLIKIDHIGMVNIIAGREICPEFIQHAVIPKDLADAVQPLLSDTEQRRAMKSGIAEVAAALEPDATRTATDIILGAIATQEK